MSVSYCIVGDESPQCSNAGVLDSEVENLLLSAAGLSVPEPALVLSGLQFPSLHMDVASMGSPWLRGSGSWAVQVLPKLRDPSQIPRWTAPVVFWEPAEARNSQHLDSTSDCEDGEPS